MPGNRREMASPMGNVSPTKCCGNLEGEGSRFRATSMKQTGNDSRPPGATPRATSVSPQRLHDTKGTMR